MKNHKNNHHNTSTSKDSTIKLISQVNNRSKNSDKKYRSQTKHMIVKPKITYIVTLRIVKI